MTFLLFLASLAAVSLVLRRAKANTENDPDPGVARPDASQASGLSALAQSVEMCGTGPAPEAAQAEARRPAAEDQPAMGPQDGSQTLSGESLSRRG